MPRPEASTAHDRAGHDLTAYVALSSAAALYAGGAVAAKIALAYIPPMTAAVVRFAITTAVLAALVLLLPRLRGAWPQRRDLPVFVLLGATGVALFHLCYFAGLRFTTASEGALFTSSNPLMTVLLAAVFAGERLTARRGVGALASGAGMGLVALGGPFSAGGPNRLLGDLILLAAALGWAVYTLVVRGVARRYSPLMITFVGALIGLLMLLPPGLWQLGEWQGAPMPLAFWTSITYLALGTSILAYFGWIVGVQRIGPSRTSVFSNLTPVLAVLFAAVVLGERLSVLQMLGVVLVLAGLYVVNQPCGAPRQPSVDGRAQSA